MERNISKSKDQIDEKMMRRCLSTLAVHVMRRETLPRVKNNLKNLPRLTELLTSPPELRTLEDAIKLRQSKLEVYKAYMPLDSNTVLIESLFNRQNNDLDELLRIIDNNLDSMTSFYLAVSFEVIDDFIRAQLGDPLTVAVSPEFRRLIVKTLYKLRYFEADEVLKLIKCLSSVEVPKDCLIMQGALKMARCLINDFDQNELIALADVTKDPGIMLAVQQSTSMRVITDD